MPDLIYFTYGEEFISIMTGGVDGKYKNREENNKKDSKKNSRQKKENSLYG
jgi:hypothetical protein